MKFIANKKTIKNIIVTMSFVLIIGLSFTIPYINVPIINNNSISLSSTKTLDNSQLQALWVKNDPEKNKDYFTDQIDGVKASKFITNYETIKDKGLLTTGQNTRTGEVTIYFTFDYASGGKSSSMTYTGFKKGISPTPSNGSSSNMAGIIGGVVGGLIFLILISLLGYYFYKKKNNISFKPNNKSNISQKFKKPSHATSKKSLAKKSIGTKLKSISIPKYYKAPSKHQAPSKYQAPSKHIKTSNSVNYRSSKPSYSKDVRNPLKKNTVSNRGSQKTYGKPTKPSIISRFSQGAHKNTSQNKRTTSRSTNRSAVTSKYTKSKTKDKRRR